MFKMLADGGSVEVRKTGAVEVEKNNWKIA